MRDLLRPNIDYYTRQIEVPDGLTIREIVNTIGIKLELIAFAYTKGNVKKLDYVPRDGEIITLQPPVSGG